MFDQKQDVATRIKAQQGIEKSFANADTEWKRVAQEAVVYCARNYREFTSDMVMEYLAQSGIHTGEPRALGAIIQGASRSGMIQKSGRYKESYRRHNAPIPVWVSNVWRAK
jgi:hypothetical protein